MRRTRKIPEINSSSSADIAFLLLIFFLVTSSFDSKTGIYRKMNPPAAEGVLRQKMEIEQQNLLTLTIDADNRIRYENEEVPLRDLRDMSKLFISHSNKPLHVISLETDRNTKYQTYLSVLSELTAAYNELRNEAANELFQMAFIRLNTGQQDSIRTLYPTHISEITPKVDKEATRP